MWICKVNPRCEPYGASHFITGHSKERLTKPVVACGIDTSDFNWTVNPNPRTACCEKCLEYIKKQEKTPHQKLCDNCDNDLCKCRTCRTKNRNYFCFYGVCGFYGVCVFNEDQKTCRGYVSRKNQKIIKAYSEDS